MAANPLPLKRLLKEDEMSSNRAPLDRPLRTSDSIAMLVYRQSPPYSARISLKSIGTTSVSLRSWLKRATLASPPMSSRVDWPAHALDQFPVRRLIGMSMRAPALRRCRVSECSYSNIHSTPSPQQAAVVRQIGIFSSYGGARLQPGILLCGCAPVEFPDPCPHGLI